MKKVDDRGFMTSELITSQAELEEHVMDVADVVAWEQEIAASGIPLAELMRRAGAAVAEVAMGMFEEEAIARKEQPIVILCGSGNNGGDGWVAAKLLAAQGYSVTLVSRDKAIDLLVEPARTNALLADGAESFKVLISPDRVALAEVLSGAALVIDAILGTGFAHDNVRAPYDEWIRLANRARAEHRAKILAVDCPSGLNAQTGAVASDCIEADTTVTMLAVKPGLVQPEAATFVGALNLASLGV